jgi:hypothetical protein
MAAQMQVPLAPPASTGNNNHASVGLVPAALLVAVEFVVEVAGGTPTVSYKLQGTFDIGSIADGSANWFDLILLPSDNETAAVTRVVTAVGAFASFLAQSEVRFAPRVRLVTSANTNITYRANLRTQYRNS